MKKIPILFTFDQSLEMPAGVCLTSLLANASPGTFYDVFILHGRHAHFAHSRLNELPGIFGNCNITFRAVGEEFVGAYVVRGIPETAYYRLVSPELIPEYDKILYSDVDVIFREDLARFYDIELEDSYFGAVDNCSALRPWVQKYVAEKLGLDFRDGYFYSGNLIINSAQIRKDKMTTVFRELGKNDYRQQDMDIINIACNKRIKPIGPSFCLTVQLYDLIVNSRDKMREIYSDAEMERALKKGIVHYNGPKPWKAACLNMDIWWEYYRKSIFFDEKFSYDFWIAQRYLLERIPLKKRIKMLFRYPLDKMMTGQSF